MALSIERLRYYDGEFLRAFDWTAEQTYQIEMRRRLHLAMGHWGIAEGLDIASDTEGTTTTYSINPGVAIDPAGREMFVFTPQQLDDTLLTQNLITSGGTYQLLLQYLLTPNTPPSGGYGQCNGGNQYTRWQESFAVLLKKATDWTQPAPLPKATDSLSENAALDGFAVPLAKVVIGPDSAGSLTVQSFTYDNRRYIGVRTQRILPPIRAKTPDITAAETALNPPTSIEMHGSVYIHDNLIVGKNFALTGPTPAKLGDVKVAGDIILQGKIYNPDSTGKWTTMAAAIQSQVVPQVVTAPTPFTVNTSPGPPATVAGFVASGSNVAPLVAAPSNAPPSYSVSASAWIAGVTWSDQTLVNNIFAAVTGAGGSVQVQYEVKVTATVVPGGASLTFNWSVAPVATISAVLQSAIDQLSFGYMVVFTPNPA